MISNLARALALRISISIFAGLLLVALLAGLGPMAMDPTYLNLGAQFNADDVARVRHELGLSGSFWHRFSRSVKDLAALRFGKSLRVGRPVRELVARRVKVTAYVMSLAVVLSVVFGNVFALLFWRRKKVRSFGMPLLAVAGMGVPLFVVSSVVAQLFPRLMMHPVERTIVGGVLLALPGVAFYALALVRRLDGIAKERFVAYSTALGLPARDVEGWTLRLAFVDVLAIAGNQLAIAVAGGTIVVEYALRLEGLGVLLLDATTWMDLPVLRVILVGASISLGLGFFVLDVIHSLLDPRHQG